MRRLRKAIRLKRPKLCSTTDLSFCITALHRLTFISFFVTFWQKFDLVPSYSQNSR